METKLQRNEATEIEVRKKPFNIDYFFYFTNLPMNLFLLVQQIITNLKIVHVSQGKKCYISNRYFVLSIT